MNAFELILSMIGPVGLAVMMTVLGLLSKRMNDTTRGTAYFRWFFVAAALLIVSALARLVGGVLGLQQDPGLANRVDWVLLYVGLPALAVSIALRTAWHYWSWLLAERD
jgi:hypothetical protein